MGENTGEIEREIRNTRENLGRNLDELGDRARELTDWRTHYRKHSGAFVGAAFVAGAMLGLATVPAGTRRRRPREYAAVDLSHDPYPAREPARRVSSSTVARAKREVSDTWGQIADALLRTASAAAIEFVGGLVPHFKDHLEPKDEGRVH